MENNDGLWWLMVVVGDRESAWNFRNGFGRKKKKIKTFGSWVSVYVELR